MDIRKLNRVLVNINAKLDLKECLISSLESVGSILDTEIISLMLLDKNSGQLLIKAAKGLEDVIIRSSKLKVGEGISGWVAKNKRPLLIKDIRRDKRFTGWGKRYNNNSLLSAPLIAEDNLIGVINVANKITKEILKKTDLEDLKGILPFISMAVYKAQKYEEAKKLAAIKLDFISVVSHELRIPMSVIKESVNLIYEGLAGEINAKQRRFLELAKNNVDRIVRLIDGLLDISKMEAGRFDMNRTLQDICAVIKNVFDTLKIKADNKGTKFDLALSSGPVNMWFDSDQITRVFVNLIDNAIKFTPEYGSVNIRSEDLDKFIRISITDNGPGIEEEDLGKIFDKYYSVIRSGHGEVKGTGLGLPISKEIVDFHGGKITVDSKLGQGTKFSVILPKDMRLSRSLKLSIPS